MSPRVRLLACGLVALNGLLCLAWADLYAHKRDAWRARNMSHALHHAMSLSLERERQEWAERTRRHP